MEPEVLARAKAAIDPRPAVQSVNDPAAAPTEADAGDAPRRRGRPPKPKDAAYEAARAAIQPDPSFNATGFITAPPFTRQRRSPKVFRRVPGAGTGKPLDMEAVKAVIKPRPGTAWREWPPAPQVRDNAPPRLSPEETRQVVDHYLERFGPILSLDEAASVAKLAKQTLRRYVCEGCFANAVYRGRPLRFLTQRFIEGCCDETDQTGACRGTNPHIYIGHRPYRGRDGQQQTTATYFAEYCAFGQQRQMSLRTTNKQQAIRRAYEIVSRLEKGEPTAPGTIGLEELARAYLEMQVNKARAPTTICKYTHILTTFVAWADVHFRRPAALFREQHFWQWHKSMIDDGYSAKTRSDRAVVVKQMFKWAVRQKLLMTDPVADQRPAHLHDRIRLRA